MTFSNRRSFLGTLAALISAPLEALRWWINAKFGYYRVTQTDLTTLTIARPWEKIPDSGVTFTQVAGLFPGNVESGVLVLTHGHGARRGILWRRLTRQFPERGIFGL